jgi:hypothetical protein
VVCATTPAAYAQTNTTGALAGIISDSTGASVSGATVTITSQGDASTHVVISNGAGEYRVSQLAPGAYSINVTATGFESAKRTVQVGINGVTAVDIALTVGKTSVTVEVTGTEAPLIHTEDAQIATEFTAEQISNLPNPGNDLTFVAQTAAGSVMNTQSEYGNFSSFGLPGTANSFTVNGGYDNDPFLNISNSGASNLLLGANDVGNETVTSNAYNASFGGLGGAQVSQTTRSGTNQFHGNASYWWNGRTLNANDFFNKQYGGSRSFDNANQYAGAVGGPVIRNKLFFFANYEGLNVVLPSRSTIYAPDATYQSTVLANLTANGLGSETAMYNAIFALYNNAPNYSSGAETANCTTAPYCTWTFNGEAGNYTHEWLVNPRADWNMGNNDHLFGHGTIDKGVQATYTNLLNPLFNAASAQPSYQAQIGEQHTFSPTISNQFLFSAIYYVAVFSNATAAQSEAIVPFGLIFQDGATGNNGGGAFPGGENFAFPQGRNVTGYTFQDDLSWTKGKHTVSVGWTIRRDDITDYSPSEFVVAPEAYTTNASFEQGYVDYWAENFPSRLTQPVSLYGMGGYIQDEWKILPNMTLTYGLRLEHNSDPVCHTNCFAHLSNDFAKVDTSNDAAYNTLIDANLNKALPSLQKVGYEPRLGFAYLPFGAGTKTTLRGGFGMFADSFPGVIADDLLNNAPTNVPFVIYGPGFGGNYNLLVPGATQTAAGITACAVIPPGGTTPNVCPGISSREAAADSNAGFQAGFSTGQSFNMISAAVPTFSAPSVTNPATQIKNPTYEEWSLDLEQQISRFDSLSIMYVGNHTYHGPELNNSINVFNGNGTPGFAEVPTSAANPNFGAVTEVSSSSVSNFNGLVLSVQHRSKSLVLNFNYQWSHALDDISNGGFEPFTGSSIYPDNPYNLHANYGNADYDTRQYVSASYVYTLPYWGGPKFFVANWQASGTFFHSTGLPFSVLDGGTSATLTNYSGALYAKQIAPLKNGANHCGGFKAATGTQCAFAADYTTADDFGEGRRNQIFGPNYTDADLAITKGFNIPHLETGKFKIGAQFFNLFNHPNFAQPYSNLTAGSALGTITAGVNPPTSILGSFLGGDASPRLVQMTMKFEF